MASLRNIRRRIRSVQSTQKITKAMKTVAAAKFRRAQQRILEARPYARQMARVLSRLSLGTGTEIHPLLARPSGHRVEILVLSTDRGLCGAFNSNIIRRTQQFVRDREEAGAPYSLSVVGRKARDAFRHRGLPARKVWTGLSGKVTYPRAAEIAGNLIDRFAQGEVDEVWMIYNEFKSVIQQQVVAEPLLPIRQLDEDSSAESGFGADYLFEPAPEVLFEDLLPRHVEIQVFRALLESAASEEGARMTAMDAATKNAKEMIGSLTLQYNRARQAAITKEILEVVGGAEALK